MIRRIVDLLSNRSEEWAVVISTVGHHVFLEDTLRHQAMAVRHWPQVNAATIRTGLSESAARKEVERLNLLNDPISRMMRINDYCDTIAP